MVDRLRARGIRDERVLAAMARVPRHLFVGEAFRDRAYEETRLPIDAGQTISQPWTVAVMTERLGVGPGDRVLEIGTGSGYQAAVLAEIGARVYTIERHAGLARTAARLLREGGWPGVTVKQFDGSFGWASEAPFDGILVTAAAPSVPDPLPRQLVRGGRLVAPIDAPSGSRLIVIERTASGWRRTDCGPARFVPLIGRHGY